MEIIKYKDCVTSVSTCHTVLVSSREHLNYLGAYCDKMMKKIIIITNGRGKNYRGNRGRKGGWKGKKRR